MKVSSLKLNNLILANLPVGHFESATLTNRKPAVPVLPESSNSQLLPVRHSPIFAEAVPRDTAMINRLAGWRGELEDCNFCRSDHFAPTA